MVLGENLADCVHQLERRLGDAVDLDQQDGAGVGRVAGVVVRLDRADGDAVHHLQGRGYDAVTDHRRHGLACGLDARKGGQQRCDAGRHAQELHLDLRDRAEGSFGAHEDPAQIEADSVGGVAVDPVHRPVRQNDLHPEDVVRGDAVVQAVRTARVFGRVAADGARLLAGRVGRIEQAVLRGGQRELLVDHARFDKGGLRDGIDLQDAAHARDLQRNAAADRDRATGKTGAGAARHHGDAMIRRHLHHTGDVLRRRREHDRVGHRTFDRTVALEDAEIVGRIDDRLAADDAAELVGDLLG